MSMSPKFHLPHDGWRTNFGTRLLRTSLIFSIAVVLIAARTQAQENSARTEAVSTDTKIEFFEKRVRPVLTERCIECHGPEKQEAGLRMDALDNLVKGGDSGPAIVPGDSSRSLLVQAIRHENQLAMPPDSNLTESEIAGLQQWVDDGAVWPIGGTPLKTSTIAAAAKTHWAFQRPIRDVPLLQSDPWIRTPIDVFVLEKLRDNGLLPSAEADRKTLIRRASYTLTGLPPTPKQVSEFVGDPDPLAYEHLVDRLLASPGYGEHWARHWLDIARYSDTKGYVYAREERFWTHAWTYRDWIVRALNQDLPYDRFLLLQLAADQVADGSPRDLAAMGFLTLGRRFLGVRRDVIDDRIDVVSRGTMGLTVSCARCHDHKYDPIPTADYYSLYGVFDSCVEEQAILSEELGDEAFRAELRKRQSALNAELEKQTLESTRRIRERTADYLFAQSELQKYPADGFDQVFQPGDLLPAIVRNWSRYLRAAENNHDPVFSIWHRCARLPSGTFAESAANVIAEYRLKGGANPLVMQALQTPPESFRECCDRFGKVFAEVDQKWQAATEEAVAESRSAPVELKDPDAEEIRRVLYGEVLYGTPGPCRIPKGPISHSETCFDTDTLTELWKLQGEVDRWLINAPQEIEVAIVLKDQPTAIEPRIFLRGNSLKLGDDVPRQFLSLFGSGTDSVFQNGSGRLELAQAIIDPDNPLTARVMVNRVWSRHFGKGLVRTESDFGLRAEQPTHPELLDWLATMFVKQGWSLKKLHRMILLSSTFRQASVVASNTPALQHAFQVDPENRWLWRMNPRRLTFEELRDSMLQVTNAIDRRMGGRPGDLFAQPFSHRRTLYGLVDRQFFASTLRVFDFSNPDLHIPRRNETTVPQQALFFLNHPMVLESARALAELARNEDPPSGISRMYQQVFQREPEPEELVDAMGLIQRGRVNATGTESPTVKDWAYGRGEFAESRAQVAEFTPLPYFSAEGWQGGPSYPDPSLGWVQLTSTGGHPGNTRSHASVRRWTAPRDIIVSIRSHWIHQPQQGDGIRIFVVHSESGLLKSAKIHHSTIDLNIDVLRLKQGETIDFGVDIDEVLNSDQYFSKIVIEELLGRKQPPTIWNSKNDFPGDRVRMLDEWEQLAHVLFCTNEFLFVD